MLNSSFYFQMLGGGMVSFLIYSRLYFLWFSFSQNHHVTEKYGRYTLWHSNKNYYQEIKYLDYQKFINTIKMINI